MNRTIVKYLLILVSGILILCFSGINLLANESSSPNSSTRFEQILSEYHRYLLDDSLESIIYRQRGGLEIEFLPDISLKKDTENEKKLQTILLKLNDINKSELSEDQQLSCQLLKWHLGNTIEGYKYRWLYFPIAPYNNLIPYFNLVYTDFQFNEEKHMQNYLNLLNQYPGFIEELISFFNKQIEMKIILAKPALQGPISYFNSIIQPVEKNLFNVSLDRLNAEVFKKNPDKIKNFQEQVAQIIIKQINPALEKLSTLISGEYLKLAPEQVGLWQYPKGKEYYRYLVKLNTTLDLTPEEIHQTGLKEIESLLGKIDQIRQKVKFSGDVNAFINYLKNDLRFKPKSPEEMGTRMMGFKQEVEKKIPLFFLKVPKTPANVKRLNPLLESSMTYGYYQHPTALDPCGYYLYNASNLKMKNVLNTASASLIMHELLPGHHFQIALQEENKSLSTFRQEFQITSYAEGWGEYAAQLGFEMGIYTDPYEQCGRLLQDLFMSVRLVVDTGMNYFQWPRDKARQLMKKYLIASDPEIESELLRYSTGIQAQALSYKIGSLKMWELRRKAEKALGDKFDIRQFHNVILGSGTMPLFMLENHVTQFIERNRPAVQ